MKGFKTTLDNDCYWIRTDEPRCKKTFDKRKTPIKNQFNDEFLARIGYDFLETKKLDIFSTQKQYNAIGWKALKR